MQSTKLRLFCRSLSVLIELENSMEIESVCKIICGIGPSSYMVNRDTDWVSQGHSNHIWDS